MNFLSGTEHQPKGWKSVMPQMSIPEGVPYRAFERVLREDGSYTKLSKGMGPFEPPDSPAVLWLIDIETPLGFVAAMRLYRTSNFHDPDDNPWLDATMAMWVRGGTPYADEDYRFRLASALAMVKQRRDDAMVET